MINRLIEITRKLNRLLAITMKPYKHIPGCWLSVFLTLVIVVAVEATSCPVDCVCARNSSVVCEDINARQWPDICIEINTLFSDTHSLLDVRLKGNDSNLTFPRLDLDCLPPLRSLDVSFVSFDRLSNALRNVNVTETLSLTQNAIRLLPENSFSSFGSVNCLNLSHNHIDGLKPKAFYGLYSLQVLDLSFNDMKSILPTVFRSLTNMTYLNLEHNQIEHITSWHLPLPSSLNVFLINNNDLKSFYVGDNESEATPLNHIERLDLSHNPLECSCVLQKMLNKIYGQGGLVTNGHNTLCQSPPAMSNMSIVQLNQTNLKCSHPHSLMTFPSKQKSVLYTSTITLECRAEAYPSPHIMWITPWGEKFSAAPLALIVHKRLANEDQINFYREYEETNVMMTSSIQVTERNDLVISSFRGSMAGNFSCVAFNEVGNETKVVHLSIHSMLKSTYVTSLKFASYCASGCLIVGFLIGFVNIVVQKLRHKVSFKVPLFTPAASVRPATITEGAPSMYSDLSPPTSPLLASSSEKSLDCAVNPFDFSGSDSSPDKRPHPLLDTIGDAKEKLRDGVGRKMETVRRNVQSIKESTGAAVHTIMESGSSAANKMKAGVVMGMETVKSHVQSVKELCGTGNMGAHTISIISMETDIDTNQQKSLVRQVTFV